MWGPGCGAATTDETALSHPPLPLPFPSLSSSLSSSLYQSGGEPRIWFLTLTADKDYPTKAPTIKFTSKIIMDCVDAKGNVSRKRQRFSSQSSLSHPPLQRPPPSTLFPIRPPQVIASKVPYLASWTSSKTMYGALVEVKNLIARAPRAQPADGTTY